MDIILPSDYGDTIDNMRTVLGRPVTMHVTVSGVACSEPGCDLNPITQLSTDQFCLVCDGFYWINTTSGWEINSRILHKGAGTPLQNPHGIVFDGDVQIRFKYTVSGLAHLRNSEYIVVDEGDYILKDYELRGVPTPNRVVATLVQKEG